MIERLLGSRGAQLAWGAACVALAVGFFAPVVAYASSSHFQEHFAVLWVMFAVALYKHGVSPVYLRSSLRDGRTWVGLTLWAISMACYWVGIMSGSSTLLRSTLVLILGAFAILSLRSWSLRRCFGFLAFGLLCFGLPESLFQPLNDWFRHLIFVAFEGGMGLLGADLQTRGYAFWVGTGWVEISHDCAGSNQLLTFNAIALMGLLTSRNGPLRLIGLPLLGTLLALACNLLRIFVLATGVGAGYPVVVDDSFVHALIGFLAFLPFAAVLIWVILKTHRALPPRVAEPEPARGLPTPWLAAPVAVMFVLGSLIGRPDPSAGSPVYMVGVDVPPGFELVARDEEVERERYDTPHLINALFRSTDGTEQRLELFAYWTESREHLNVHKIRSCIAGPSVDLEMGEPVEVAGRTFYAFAFEDGGVPFHGFYAFFVDGEDLDDSFATQFAVLMQRVSGQVAGVGLTRILLSGPQQPGLSARDRAILEWRAAQLEAASGRASGD